MAYIPHSATEASSITHPWVGTIAETNLPSIRFRTPPAQAATIDDEKWLLSYSAASRRPNVHPLGDLTCASTLLNETTLQGTKLDYASQILPWLYLNIWVAVGPGVYRL